MAYFSGMILHGRTVWKTLDFSHILVGKSSSPCPARCVFPVWPQEPQLTSRELLTSAVFALSFGFVEAPVAIYLGIDLLPGYARTLSDVTRLSADLDRQAQQVSNLPPGLLTVEVFREATTILMLLSAAALAKQKRGERCAVFLWIFALWDIDDLVFVKRFLWLLELLGTISCWLRRRIPGRLHFRDKSP
jgi:hypothetical protein